MSSEFAKRYRAAYMAGLRYRDAQRRGWVDPKGRKTADNQTIEIPRREAMSLADGLCSALYGNYSRLYENMALRNYMHQIADGEPGAVTCKTCHFCFLSDWMNGECLYCAASEAAREQVQELLEEASKPRPERRIGGNDGTTDKAN